MLMVSVAYSYVPRGFFDFRHTKFGFSMVPLKYVVFTSSNACAITGSNVRFGAYVESWCM